MDIVPSEQILTKMLYLQTHKQDPLLISCLQELLVYRALDKDFPRKAAAAASTALGQIEGDERSQEREGPPPEPFMVPIDPPYDPRENRYPEGPTA